MNRQEFIRSFSIVGIMGSTQTIKALADTLPDKDSLMPALFIGHGSPTNALEDNEFTRNWKRLSREMPRPTAILCISAHWLTNGSYVTAMNAPRTIHDFGGFGKELYEAQYPAPGHPEIAKEAQDLITSSRVRLDHEWGFDHGSWSVAKQMYPEADIPMIQLSIDYHKSPRYHYDLSKQLYSLRKKGILIIGSGNLIHNIRLADPSRGFAPDENGVFPSYAFDWADEFNEKFKGYFLNGNFQAAVDYEKLGELATLAHPTPDHYYPLLYTLGVARDDEKAEIFNDKSFVGSLSMTSVKFG